MTNTEIKNAARAQAIQKLVEALDLPYQVGSASFGYIETVTDEDGFEHDVPIVLQATAKSIEGDKAGAYDIAFEDSEYAREKDEKEKAAAARKAEREKKSAEQKAKREAREAAKAAKKAKKAEAEAEAEAESSES